MMNEMLQRGRMSYELSNSTRQNLEFGYAKSHSYLITYNELVALSHAEKDKEASEKWANDANFAKMMHIKHECNNNCTHFQPVKNEDDSPDEMQKEE